MTKDAFRRRKAILFCFGKSWKKNIKETVCVQNELKCTIKNEIINSYLRLRKQNKEIAIVNQGLSSIFPRRRNKFMKKWCLFIAAIIVILCFAIVACAEVDINEGWFPDDVFRAYVKQFDTDGNEKLSNEEADAVESIDVTGLGIKTLDGLSTFTCLKSLKCGNNLLTYIYLDSNREITSLSCEGNSLTALYLTNLFDLEELNCSNNQLNELDISGKLYLEDLKCYGNKISELDIRDCHDLTKAIVLNERSELDKYYYWGGQDTGHLSVDKNVKIISGLETGVGINKSNFPDDSLREYIAYYHDDNRDWILDKNEISKVTGIFLPSKGISTLKGMEYFTSLEDLTCSGNKLTSLDMSAYPKLRELDCRGNSLTSLNLSQNTELEKLECYGCPVKTLDVSNCTKLKELDCARTDISELDVSNCPLLEKLSCWNNYLTSLELDNNTKLTELICFHNNLKKLVVKHNTELTKLNCSENELTELDLSKNTKLVTINCSQNRIKALDISKSPSVWDLSCSYNQITELTIGANSVIFALDCRDNLLTSLDVSNNPGIIYLWCAHNKLTMLNVSKCKYLVALIKETERQESQFDDYDCNYWFREQTDNDLYVDKNVRIIPVPVESVSLDNSSLNLTTGESKMIACTIYPSCAGNQSINWSSDHPEVATVDANGKVTAVAFGKAIITVTTEDGQKTANCNVTVEPTDKPELEPADKVEAFVTRCYKIILGRKPDAGGLKTWYNELISGRKAAAEIIEQFVGSAEYQGKNLSNADSVEILYKAMLGRGSDPAGKADWVGKLEAGQPLTAVINGFCGSTEFKAICDSYGIQPGSVTPPDPSTMADSKIKAFVTRCYQIILSRNPDEGGLNTWFNELKSGRKAASEIIDSFVRSNEFQNKNLSNADAVEILYKAMLGRGSDTAGKADWVGKLDAGQPFAAVINGFCGSTEFKAICDTYGITPGSVSNEQSSGSDAQIRAFVTRCYKIILGRDPDGEGMNTWFNELKSRRRAAAEIIEQFVYSQEFQNKKYSNPDAVEILYKAMLGRGSDPAGKADWVAKLNNGQPLTAIINGFCGSMEFGAICDAYGITPGSVQVQQLSSQPLVEEEPVAKQTVTKTENNVTKVEIVNPSDTENAQLGTAVQAIYINEEKAKEFIGRCYRCILSREASPAELDSWISQMLNGTKTADQIARGFLFSGEFKDKNVSNEELVKILYRVYLNREADAEGLETWMQKLDEGTSLQALLDTFSKTNEFRSVVAEMSK